MPHVFGHSTGMDFADIGGVAEFDPSTYGLGGPADIEQSFIGDPAGLWKTARSKALGQRAFQPQFQKNIMAGFNPAWGGYLLGGGAGGTFADYLRGAGGQLRPGQGGANAWGTPNLGIGSNWANVVAASRALDPNASQMVEGMEGLGRQKTYQGYINPSEGLSEAAARQNALAIAGAAMGGGVGYGASMRQRALGNLYDIYSQRALGAGAPGGGFLGYLGGLTGTGAPATTAAATIPAATGTPGAVASVNPATPAAGLTALDLGAGGGYTPTVRDTTPATGANVVSGGGIELLGPSLGVASPPAAGANVVSGGGMELLGPSLSVASTGPWNQGPDSLRYLQSPRPGDGMYVPGMDEGDFGLPPGRPSFPPAPVTTTPGDPRDLFPGDFGIHTGPSFYSPPVPISTGGMARIDPYNDPWSGIPGVPGGDFGLPPGRPSFPPSPPANVIPTPMPLMGLPDLPMGELTPEVLARIEAKRRSVIQPTKKPWNPYLNFRGF
jgi:hypothetical protein